MVVMLLVVIPIVILTVEPPAPGDTVVVGMDPVPTVVRIDVMAVRVPFVEVVVGMDPDAPVVLIDDIAVPLVIVIDGIIEVGIPVVMVLAVEVMNGVIDLFSIGAVVLVGIIDDVIVIGGEEFPIFLTLIVVID